jgi:formylglycine-generating enzyme required for sulfatase activity
LVTDDIKGSDNLFSAHLIDTKDSKLSGKGSYVRTGVGTSELPRVALALAKQLEGPERKHRASAPVRSYPAEMDIEMVFVEGGTFTMGCVPERDGTCNNNELPAHSVTVSSFYIGKYEVTQAQWIAVTGSNPSYYKTDDQQPVERVSWKDVDTTFLRRLNALTGRTESNGYRLPTEAEWEWAARGGVNAQSQQTVYSGSNTPAEVGWYSSNSTTPKPVGQKEPNALGIYDMSGNIWEMCSDWYSDNYSTILNDKTNPKGPGSGYIHTNRGGCFWHTNTSLRVCARGVYIATPSDRGVGFRVALPAQ